MRKFNKEKFCQDLKRIRMNTSQELLAKEIAVNRSTLSLLENGRQVPSLEVFNRICDIGNLHPEEYFFEEQADELLYLMGKMDEEDKENVEDLMERVKIKEKYFILSKRCEEYEHF